MDIRAPLYEKLIQFAKQQHCSFHVPGHKNGRAYEQFGEFPSMLQLDLTELPGLDDLHQPEGVIAEAQQLAASLYRAEETFFLVNGSTVGTIALILTVCNPGDLILVQRNVHKSVIHGLMLAGVQAVFLAPEMDRQSGTALTVRFETIKQAAKQYPQARALFLTNPTYYGVAADLTDIASLLHAHEMLLLVDEAHGAHFGFHPAWPRSAMQCGADAAVQSTHKMLASMTMSAMLHIQGERIDRRRLRRTLAMLQSSSPSYVLMASLDLARARLAAIADYAFDRLLRELAHFRDQLHQTFPQGEVRLLDSAQDPCKLLLRVQGMSGFALQTQLMNHRCPVELADERQVLLALSIETTADDLAQLLRALQAISLTNRSTTKDSIDGILYIEQSEPILFALNHPEDCELSDLMLEEAVGRCCAESVTPYPPGIPLVLPGERFTAEHVKLLHRMVDDGVRVHGLTLRDGIAYVRVRNGGIF